LHVLQGGPGPLLAPLASAPGWHSQGKLAMISSVGNVVATKKQFFFYFTTRIKNPAKFCRNSSQTIFFENHERLF